MKLTDVPLLLAAPARIFFKGPVIFNSLAFGSSFFLSAFFSVRFWFCVRAFMTDLLLRSSELEWDLSLQ